MIAILLLATVLDLASYRARLERIDAMLERRDDAAARTEARALLGDTVRVDNEVLSPDAWVLSPIARGEPHRARLRGLLDSLAGTEGARPLPDRALLEDLRREQTARDPASGGEMSGLPAPGISFTEQLRNWAAAAGHFLYERLRDLWRWLRRTFTPPEIAGSTAGSITRMVLVAVGLILALVLALAFGTARRGPAPQAPLPSARRPKDEDPLSRTGSGWEERALELAQEGRAREAIRAWYHALLVRCYGAGILHYRRGRTNWEYMRTLPPRVPWRPQFEDLTRRFDVEWYGHAESTPEALSSFAGTAREILREMGSRT